MLRVLLLVICCCFCFADENVNVIQHLPENDNAKVSYNNNNGLLILYVQTDNGTQNCSLSLPYASPEYIRYLNFSNTGETFVNSAVFTSPLLNCSQYQLPTSENATELDQDSASDTELTEDDTSREERLLKFNKNKKKKDSKRRNSIIKTTTVKPNRVTNTNNKDKFKQPVTVGTNYPKPVKLGNPKIPNVVVAMKTDNTSTTIRPNTSFNSTTVSVTKNATNISNETIVDPEKLTSGSADACGVKKYLNWCTYTALGIGLVVFLLCIACIVYKIKKRKRTKKAKKDSRLECHYSAAGSQTTVYSIPSGPGIMGPRSDNGEIQYAILDITPSKNIPKKNMAEESPYAEVIPDASGHLYPVCQSK